MIGFNFWVKQTFHYYVSNNLFPFDKLSKKSLPPWKSANNQFYLENIGQFLNKQKVCFSRFLT